MNFTLFSAWALEKVSTVAQVTSKHVYVYVCNYQCVPIHGLPLIRIPVLQPVEVGRGYALLIFSTFLQTLVEIFHHC